MVWLRGAEIVVVQGCQITKSHTGGLTHVFVPMKTVGCTQQKSTGTYSLQFAKMSNFTDRENLILIKNVRQNSVLFDTTHIQYRNVELKNHIWKNISLNVEKPGKKTVFNLVF